MGLKWYELRSRYGSIIIKARYEWEAVREAARRWNCRDEEIVCVGWTSYKR